MVFSLIGAREEELEYRKTDKLRELCGVVNAKEMTNYLQGPRFAPYFKIYAKTWIYPQLRKVQALGTSQGQGANFETVEEQIIVGERLGSDKFSTEFPYKTLWDREDYLAYALFQICCANTKSAAGLFFNKGLSQTQIHLRAWLLIKHEEFNHAPSRRKAREAAAAKELWPTATQTGCSVSN